MIELQQVDKKFGDFEAVSNLDLQVKPGEIYGFLGPNGAGKTTTVRMMVGLLQITSGVITICGHNVENKPVAVKEITGYIPDTPYVYPQLTMNEYLDFIEDIYNLDTERSTPIRKKYFRKFRLGEWHQDLIKNLSHGMKQKMLLTGVFMVRPEVIIIDEPMVGLDPHSSRVMKNSLLEEAEKNNTAVFLSTHSLQVAEEICDRVGILDHGRLLAEGEFEQLQQKDSETLEEVFLRLTEEKTSTTVK